tara:strand:+ start:613 stop:1056 length:444 start_codon:yes stop_codon:yes gene_type:complete
MISLRLIQFLFIITNTRPFLINIKPFMINNKRDIPLNLQATLIKTDFIDKTILMQSILDINPYLIIDDDTSLLSIKHNLSEFSDISIRQKNGTDIIFTFEDGCYQMISDLQYWHLPVSIDEFMNLLNQKYSINTILRDLDQEGFYVN